MTDSYVALQSTFLKNKQRPAPLSVTDLIKQSNETFSFINNKTIENLRNAALLVVGQNLQDSSRRSLLRATMENAKFTRKELEVLYKWFEVKAFVVNVYSACMSNTSVYTVASSIFKVCLEPLCFLNNAH